jgi:antiphage defense system Thoeris ThsB-like protein
MPSDALFQKPKRKIFVSHDHFADAHAYETFKRIFSSLYDIVRDNSLERELDGTDGEGFIRGLREGPLRDCDCLVVLCGAKTHEDRFVDWEIKAALEERIGLLAILFPANLAAPAASADAEDPRGQPLLPDRLRENFDGGYAVVCRWSEIVSTRVDLTSRIQFAMDREREMIRNARPLMNRLP